MQLYEVGQARKEEIIRLANQLGYVKITTIYDGEHSLWPYDSAKRYLSLKENGSVTEVTDSEIVHLGENLWIEFLKKDLVEDYESSGNWHEKIIRGLQFKELGEINLVMHHTNTGLIVTANK